MSASITLPVEIATHQTTFVGPNDSMQTGWSAHLSGPLVRVVGEAYVGVNSTEHKTEKAARLALVKKLRKRGLIIKVSRA